VCLPNKSGIGFGLVSLECLLDSNRVCQLSVLYSEAELEISQIIQKEHRRTERAEIIHGDLSVVIYLF
jgi:hypothetical protein